MQSSYDFAYPFNVWNWSSSSTSCEVTYMKDRITKGCRNRGEQGDVPPLSTNLPIKCLVTANRVAFSDYESYSRRCVPLTFGMLSTRSDSSGAKTPLVKTPAHLRGANPPKLFAPILLSKVH